MRRTGKQIWWPAPHPSSPLLLDLPPVFALLCFLFSLPSSPCNFFVQRIKFHLHGLWERQLSDWPLPVQMLWIYGAFLPPRRRRPGWRDGWRDGDKEIGGFKEGGGAEICLYFLGIRRQMGALRGGLRSRPPWMAGKLTPMWLGALLRVLPVRAWEEDGTLDWSPTTLPSDDWEVVSRSSNELRNGGKQELFDSKLIPKILVADLSVRRTKRMKQSFSREKWVKGDWYTDRCLLSPLNVALQHFNLIQTQILLGLLILTVHCFDFLFLLASIPVGFFRCLATCCFSAPEDEAECDYQLCEALMDRQQMYTYLQFVSLYFLWRPFNHFKYKNTHVCTAGNWGS